MGKRILAIILGIISAFVVIVAVQMVGNSIYKLPEGVNQNDLSAMKQVIINMPPGAFLFVLFSYASGSFIGGLVSALIFKAGKYSDAVIIGGVLMIFGLINLTMLPHPFWFWIASLILYIPLSLLGARIRR